MYLYIDLPSNSCLESPCQGVLNFVSPIGDLDELVLYGESANDTSLLKYVSLRGCRQTCPLASL
jgi:hypothetical protein